ncbi:MAG TPA: TonB family protein [Pyrinomonadaceae bacterium]|jgi:TonB family protein
MKLFSCKLFSLAFPILAMLLTVSGQTSAPSDWETLRPDGEEFSVLMPKGSTAETSKEPYHKMELNTRTYLSKTPTGAVFAVVSLSGIKSNPALYTEMQRMNSYVDAFKTLFSPKIRKDAVAKLTLVGDKTLQGNPGREYRMTLGDLNGTAQVFATRKRFYSIVYLDTKKNDALQEQFLSSFVLPEKTTSPATASAQAPATVAAAEEPAPQPAETPKPASNAERDAKTEEPAHSEPGKRAPVSAGVLNSRAISLPMPDYPAEARAVGAEGVVVIQVTVDEQGNVTEARALSGPKMLHEVSLNAARQAKFSPTLLSGEPVKLTGVLVFNFGRPLS